MSEHPDTPEIAGSDVSAEMNRIFEQSWRVWPTVIAMATDTKVEQGRLYRAKEAGKLPPIETWVKLMKRAKQEGSPLTWADLVWFYHAKHFLAAAA